MADEQWSRDELRRIVDEACTRYTEEYRPVVVWARGKMEEEQLKKERFEKLRTTVVGWSFIWVLGGFLYVVGEGVTAWLKKIIGADE